MNKFLIAICLLMLSLRSNAQVINDSTRILAGLELNTYTNDPFGLEIKLVRHRKLSFVFKVNRFNYDAGYYISRYDNFYNNIPDVSNTYKIHGFTIKPGLSIINRIKKHYIITWSQLLVITSARHDMSINYNDGMGYSEKHYLKNTLNLGFESDFTFHVKLFNGAYLSASVKIGYKETNLHLYDNVIKNYPTYYNYTPSQGYSLYPVYHNASLALGAMF